MRRQVSPRRRQVCRSSRPPRIGKCIIRLCQVAKKGNSHATQTLPTRVATDMQQCGGGGSLSTSSALAREINAITSSGRVRDALHLLFLLPVELGRSADF